MRVRDENNWIAIPILLLMLAWLLKGLLFKDIDAEIESKAQIVKEGQSSENIAIQRRGVIAQKELVEMQERKLAESGERKEADLEVTMLQ